MDKSQPIRIANYSKEQNKSNPYMLSNNTNQKMLTFTKSIFPKNKSQTRSSNGLQATPQQMHRKGSKSMSSKSRS
jgi:hypothetical protein